MPDVRAAEWILSQVIPPDRAASTIGDWLEDAAERGNIWFWSCVLRTVASRIWRDFAESPGFLMGLAMRGWLYSIWLMVGTYFGLFLGVCILVPVALLVGYLANQLQWHPSWPFHRSPEMFNALIAQIWVGWCQFQAGRWIARRAPGRELTAGITACLTPPVFFVLLGLLSMHFWSAEISRFLGNHPDNPGSLPGALPTGIFLLAGILWSRHKSIRSVAQ